MPAGTYGTAYSQTVVAVGGTPAYTFAVTAGALPDGLTLAADGLLGGVPTVPGNFTFTITATDASEDGPLETSREYVLIIDKAPLTITADNKARVYGSANPALTATFSGLVNGDTAAVVFDAVQAAAARNIDVVIADTAGRLPTQLHLMEELKKVKRVIARVLPGAPHEVLLVLDANNGQNAVAQLKAFDDALGVTGLIITKLDGTAKGGALAAIARHKTIPLRFIGIGEGIDDLRPFVAQDFVDALFE